MGDRQARGEGLRRYLRVVAASTDAVYSSVYSSTCVV